MRFFIHSLRRLGGLTRLGGFTLIELLAVMTIIAILAALVLSVSGYANKKAALARATSEKEALCAACESYKADNGGYPHQPLAISGSIPAISSSTVPPSDLLSAVGTNANGNSASTDTSYTNASLELYEALTGDVSCTGTGGGIGVRNYVGDLRQDVLGRSNPSVAVSSANPVLYLSDPFGNSYGYSTAYATAISSGSTAAVASTVGYNPTFDLWSTGGQLNNPYNGTGALTSGSAGDPMLQWITNWR